MGYYKTDPESDEYVYIPFDDIDGIKKYPDKSISLKLIGGKYHDYKIRMYPPYDVMWFADGATYELHPPIAKARSKKWVMVHNSEVLYGNIPFVREGVA